MTMGRRVPIQPVLLIAMIVVVLTIGDGGDYEADEKGYKSSLGFGLTFSREERLPLSIEP